MKVRLLPLAALSLALSACTFITPDLNLHFTAGPAGGGIDAATLLHRQIVPADRLLTFGEAWRRAPIGSVILTCWKDSDITNFWGPCSHITRKYSDTQVMETYSFSRPLAGVYPISVLNHFYALVVLDTGVTPEMLPKMWAAAHKLDGSIYRLNNLPGSYYCSTYQNYLQAAVGLKEVVPFDPWLQIALPADALQEPGARVLWVGVNDDSPASYRGSDLLPLGSD